MVLVNLSLPCYAIVMSGMSGYLDGLNFDSDEDFEETAGRASTRQADRQDEARVPGLGRGRGGGVGRGRGGVVVGRGAILEGFSQVAGPSVAVDGRGAGQAGQEGGAATPSSQFSPALTIRRPGQAGQGGGAGGVEAPPAGVGAPPVGVEAPPVGRGGGQAGRGRGRGRGGRGGGQGGRRAKFRNWCVTINNYSGVPDAEFLKGPPPIKYLCFGKEVSSTGTPHLQMYVSFANAVAQPSQYFTRFGNGHFIPANGTADQNAEYCAKEGDFREFGTRPQSPRDKGQLGAQLGGQPGGQYGQIGGDMEQARWQMTWDLAKEGRIEEIPADIRVRHYSTINKIAAKYQKAPPKLSKLDNLWLVGPPGTGKSTFVHNQYPGGYKKSMTKWWCGYNMDDEGHSTVILDDLHPRWSEKELLKNWADVFSFVAETKGGSMQIRPQRIVVTSNYTIEQVLLFRKPFCPQTGERIASLSSVLSLSSLCPLIWPRTPGIFCE